MTCDHRTRRTNKATGETRCANPACGTVLHQGAGAPAATPTKQVGLEEFR